METNLLIVRSMQLPIILLLVIFSVRASYAYRTKRREQNIRKSDNSLIDDLPFFFLEIGFVTNLISILVEIILGEAHPTFRLIVGSLTTAFFLMSALFHFFTYNENRLFKLSICVFSIFVIVGVNLLFKKEEPKWIPHIIDFIVFAFTSIFLYQRVSIRDIIFSNFYTNNYVLIGFWIWTFLQLWKPIGPYIIEPYILKPEDAMDWTNLVGYSVSAFGKGLILFGLYNFSIKKVEHAILNERKKNDQLSVLQELINSISNSKSIQNLAKDIVEHLTNKKVFNFEYAIFSEVNYPKYKVFYKDSKTTNSKIKLVEEWVLSEGITLNHYDIMALVVRKRKAIHAYGEMLDGKKINISDSDSPLNKSVYEKYEHKNLNRFFIPVLNLKDTKESNNRVVAIIEVGYYIPPERIYVPNRIFQQAELNIYLDNCAQAYERIVNQDIQNQIDLLIKTSDEQSRDEPLKYLQEVLASTCNFLNVENGFILLFPLNIISRNHNLIFGENTVKEKDKPTIEKMLSNCIEHSIDNNNDLIIQENKFEIESNNILKSNSIQICKIKVHDLTIGYLFLLSQHEKFFNEVVQNIVNNISTNIGSNYNEKKFHNSVASLVTPDNAITDLEANMQPLIEMLKGYFETHFISIWLKDNSDCYIQKYASKEFQKSCKKFGTRKMSIDEISLDDEFKIVNLLDHNTNVEYDSFKEYGQKNGIKTLIQKPIKTQHQQFGFINIYLKNNTSQLIYEEINFLNLISVKCLITLQIHNLVSAFRDISNSFTKNDLKTTLQTITDSAMSLLNADPVILYKSNNGEDVFFNDVTYSFKEDFRNKEILDLFESKKDSHVELAELIISDKSMFFNNDTEYNNYVNKQSKIHEQVHFKKSFWERENIKSLAAIKLVNNIKNNIKPVGVMFINFRKEITFNEETKRIIETFAAFAAGSIYNGFVFERNRQYLLSNLRLTKPLLAEALTAGALHDAKKTFSSIHAFYNGLIKKIDNPYDVNNKKMDATGIRRELGRLEVPILDLEEHFTKIESLYKPAQVTVIKSVDLVKLIRNQLEVMDAELHQNHIRVIFEPLENEVFIDCDESQIGLAILNILKNAYQALGTRGILEVKLKQTENEKVKIEIIDDGKGISDDIKDLIFEPYITDKIGGSGLGLPMSKYVIEINHFGNIKGLTKDNRTTFTIFLPIKHLKPIE